MQHSRLESVTQLELRKLTRDDDQSIDIVYIIIYQIRAIKCLKTASMFYNVKINQS